jgi:DNA polymerase III epsilon subunit-like protein
MKDQNQKLAASHEKLRSLVLEEQELVSFALDEEEAATKLGEDIYRNAMAQKVLRYKKMSEEEWVQRITEWTGATRTDSTQAQRPHEADNASLASSLSTAHEISILRYLRTPLDGLQKYGYVTTKPTATELAAAKAAAVSAAGFETCDRCGTRFQVFPGRDDKGRLTSKGKCFYHWARASRNAGSKTDRITGQAEMSYPCCNKTQGSEGCTEAETHVFNVKDARRLATILQFENTPGTNNSGAKQPLSFDCEMGYTTLGLEVIRVTAVSWPDARPVLDFLVRPYGEVLDLNTRFSGVTNEAYSNAKDYDSVSLEEDGMSQTSITVPLKKVASPAAARQLLFEHLDTETPLIGHAIDNDLNVCRIIHPFVVDTVLLYPHPRSLPFRYGLKVLSQKYLRRGIQTGGAAGHDSKEDAVATGDLVRKKVMEKWSVLQHDGWEFVDGVLKPPDATTGSARTRQASML